MVKLINICHTGIFTIRVITHIFFNVQKIKMCMNMFHKYSFAQLQFKKIN